MKRLIIFLLLFAAIKVAGQTTGYLRFDTVKIMKQNGTCELYIINATKDSLGLLTNIGGGLTRFIKSRSLNDSTIIIGLDTIVIRGATGGSAGPVGIGEVVGGYGLINVNDSTLRADTASPNGLVTRTELLDSLNKITITEKPVIVKAGSDNSVPDTLALSYSSGLTIDGDSVLIVDSSIYVTINALIDSLAAFEFEAIVHNAGDSGIALGYASNDTFNIKRLNCSGCTIVTNADSSITITVTGGGGGMAIGGAITSATEGSVLFAGASGVLAQDNTNFFWNNTDDRLGIRVASPASPLHVRINSIGGTVDDTETVTLDNTTAAANGAQQASPALTFEGRGWNTTSSASHSSRYRMYLLPLQGNPITSRVEFQFSEDGAAWNQRMTLSNTGLLTANGGFTTAGSVTSGGSVIAGATGQMLWTSGARMRSPAAGDMLIMNNAQNGFGKLILGLASSSFYSIKHSTNALQIRLGDDANYGDLEVLDEAYGAGWNASNEVPTKNAVYDKIETMSGGAFLYQFVSTQQITVTNTTTETTIYGTGQGSAGIDGTANVTTGTQVILKGAGTIDTDGAVAGEPTFAFKFPTSTVSIAVTGLANGLTGSTYTYEFKAIPLGTGTGQDYIWFFEIFVENNGTPVIIKVTGRETGVLTTTGTLTMDVTVDWNTADTDNTLVANYNTIEIIKK